MKGKEKIEILICIKRKEKIEILIFLFNESKRKD